MSVLYILIPLALLLGGGALVAFLSALKRGQFDDLETPAWRAVFEDKAVKEDASSKPKEKRPASMK
jgi:cbb3-type cytochrome oxidase maturation protein